MYFTTHFQKCKALIIRDKIAISRFAVNNVFTYAALTEQHRQARRLLPRKPWWPVCWNIRMGWEMRCTWTMTVHAPMRSGWRGREGHGSRAIDSVSIPGARSHNCNAQGAQGVKGPGPELAWPPQVGSYLTVHTCGREPSWDSRYVQQRR